MNSILFSLFVLIASLTFSLGDDDQKCKNDFRQFLTCAKTQISETERKSIKDDTQSKSNTCFQNAGCTAPESNAGGGEKHKGGMGQLMQMPESVKKCLKKKLLEKVGAKLNECLSRKGVHNVNFSEIAESLEGSGAEVGASAHGEGGHELQGAMQAKFSIVKGVDKCCVDKFGSDTTRVRPLEQCLQDIKKTVKPRICNDLKPCDSRVSRDCLKRGQDLKKAMCQCKKEKEREMAGKLAELGKQSKVPMQDLVHAAADDQDISGIMNDVDACYSENNEQMPPMLKLAMQLFSGGGRGGAGGGGGARFGAAMSVDGRQVTIMSDMLLLDANDSSECEPCQ